MHRKWNVKLIYEPVLYLNVRIYIYIYIFIVAAVSITITGTGTGTGTDADADAAVVDKKCGVTLVIRGGPRYHCVRTNNTTYGFLKQIFDDTVMNTRSGSNE